jgi:hypothetical protein
MSEGANLPNSKKLSRNTIFWIVSGVALALYLLVVPLGLYGLCSAPEQFKEIVPGHISLSGQQIEQHSNGPQNTSVKIPVVGKAIPTQQIIEQMADATYYPPKEPVGVWWRSAVCTVTLSDYLIGLFTLILAISTIGLWWQTERLAKEADDQSEKMSASVRAMEKQAKNARLVHRPFLTIRGIALAPFEGRVPGPTEVVLDNGKTGVLAVVKCVFENRGHSMCQLLGAYFISNTGRAIGPMPDPSTNSLFGDFIIGEGSTYDPGLPICTSVLPKDLKWDKGDSTFVCGWVRYADLFGIIRRHGFAYEYYQPITGELFGDHFVSCGPESYWYEVEESEES